MNYLTFTLIQLINFSSPMYFLCDSMMSSKTTFTGNLFYDNFFLFCLFFFKKSLINKTIVRLALKCDNHHRMPKDFVRYTRVRHERNL